MKDERETPRNALIPAAYSSVQFYSFNVLRPTKTPLIRLMSVRQMVINTVNFLIHNSQASYLERHGNTTVIDTSYIKFEFKGLPSLGENLEIINSSFETMNETCELPWRDDLLGCRGWTLR